MAYKNIAIFGGSGQLGEPVLNALIESGKFNITAISRPGSKATFPSSVKVVKADYKSVEELTKALQGQDAVISAVGNEGFAGQPVFVDAAIAAGVKRFIPSEFGSNLANEKVSKLAVFGHKIATRKYIEEKVAGGADITYSYIINSAFLDWGLAQSFIFNWSKGKPEIYDGGDVPFNGALLSHIGQATVGTLLHPEETKNRQVVVVSALLTQNKLYELAKKANPEKAGSWELVDVNTADLEKSNAEATSKGDFSFPVIYNQLQLSVFGGKAYGQPLKDDNELLGIKHLTDDELVALWKKVLA